MPRASRRLPAACEFHFLHRLPFDTVLALQRRLAFEAGERPTAAIVVLVCEHPPLITIGRAGSRADVRLSSDELARGQLEIQYVLRGGGTVLHGPGQMCVYVIAPLNRLRWTPRHFRARLRQGFRALLAEPPLSIHGENRRYALLGRTGPLVVLGVAVRGGVSLHGAFLNVVPEPGPFGYIDVLPAEPETGQAAATLSSLAAERGRAVRPSSVRTALVTHLTAAFGASQSYVHAGHPGLGRQER